MTCNLVGQIDGLITGTMSNEQVGGFITWNDFKQVGGLKEGSNAAAAGVQVGDQVMSLHSPAILENHRWEGG